MRGIHPLVIFKMADVQGGMPLISALARMMNHGYAFLAELTFCVSLFCDKLSTVYIIPLWQYEIRCEAGSF